MNDDEPEGLTAIKLRCFACDKYFIVPDSKVPNGVAVGSSFIWNEQCSGCWECGREREVESKLKFDGTEEPRQEYLVATPLMVVDSDDAPHRGSLPGGSCLDGRSLDDGRCDHRHRLLVGENLRL
jgi:hypothetical protein